MTLSYRHSSHNREFHNVNCRFCGAIHSVDWACISVLSQVIHNVNERKTVQTNMISFVSHGAGILTIMEASTEHDCCSEAQRNARRTETSYLSAPFFFHLRYEPLVNFGFCRLQHGLTDFHNLNVACHTALDQ